MFKILATVSIALLSYVALSEAQVPPTHTGNATWAEVASNPLCVQPSPNFITVALSPSDFGDPDGDNLCNKVIFIVGPGRTAEANVIDICASCASGDLSMSPQLFEEFAPLSQGLITDVEWQVLS